MRQAAAKVVYLIELSVTSSRCCFSFEYRRCCRRFSSRLLPSDTFWTFGLFAHRQDPSYELILSTWSVIGSDSSLSYLPEAKSELYEITIAHIEWIISSMLSFILNRNIFPLGLILWYLGSSTHFSLYSSNALREWTYELIRVPIRQHKYYRKDMFQERI